MCPSSPSKGGSWSPKGDHLLSQLLWDTLVGEGNPKVSGWGGGKEYWAYPVPPVPLLSGEAGPIYGQGEGRSRDRGVPAPHLKKKLIQ